MDAEGTDVYVTEAFWPVGKTARKENAAAGLLGLCLDIDVNGSPERDGTFKTGAAPTIPAALKLATAIAPPTFIVFSGGGIQPWWLFDEPWVFADGEERAEAKRLATDWQAAHAARVPWRIDSTHDLARVRRIPGTHNHKADPPRAVTIKKTPGARRHAVADLRVLVAVASIDPAPARASLNGHATVPGDRMAAIVATPGVAAVLADRPANPSARDHAVAKEAMRAYASDAEIADLIAHLRTDDPKRKGARADYVERTIAKARTAVREEARPTRARRVTLTRSSNIQPEQVTSAWAPYTSTPLVVAAGGSARSGQEHHARLHRGEAVPRGTLEGAFHGEPTGVVIVTAEDSLTATVTPRLMAAGADLDHVRLLQVEADGATGLLNLAADLPALQEAIADVGARVVLLDPLVAFFDRVDSHNDQQVRRILAPLAQWADEHNLALNGLIHTNKREGHDALTRVSGSIAFTGVARSLLMIGRHPDDEDESAVHLVHEKYNLGKRGPSWRCLLHRRSPSRRAARPTRPRASCSMGRAMRAGPTSYRLRRRRTSAARCAMRWSGSEPTSPTGRSGRPMRRASGASRKSACRTRLPIAPSERPASSRVRCRARRMAVGSGSCRRISRRRPARGRTDDRCGHVVRWSGQVVMP